MSEQISQTESMPAHELALINLINQGHLTVATRAQPQDLIMENLMQPEYLRFAAINSQQNAIANMLYQSALLNQQHQLDSKSKSSFILKLLKMIISKCGTLIASGIGFFLCYNCYFYTKKVKFILF